MACYAIGIAVANFRLWELDREILEGVAGGSMLFGLPLLLYVVRLKDSLRYGRSMLACFALCCGSGLLCTAAVGYLQGDAIADSWKVSGMLVGLYTGGTPNVQAIGLALDAPPDYLVLVQASDVLLGGAYLLGLITFLPGIYARLYRPSPGPAPADEVEVSSESEPPGMATGQLLTQIGVTAAIVAIAVGSDVFVTASFPDFTWIVLVLTTLSLLVASSPLSQRIGNSYPTGEYFLLVFSVALGLMADFRTLAANGGELLYFSFLALCATTLLHLLASRIFNFDRDTVILSSVAAFYGPVFVVQVAAAIGNKRLMASGLAVSLLGFGLGNYLGVTLAYGVRWLLH